MDTYYTAVEHPELVTFSKRKYITIDGEGAPGSESFYDKKTFILNFFILTPLFCSKKTGLLISPAVLIIFYS